MKAWVLLITHGEGLEVSLHADEAGAERAAASWARDNWDEGISCIGEIGPPLDDEEAIRLYFMDEDSYEIRELEIDQ